MLSVIRYQSTIVKYENKGFNTLSISMTLPGDKMKKYIPIYQIGFVKKLCTCLNFNTCLFSSF